MKHFWTCGCFKRHTQPARFALNWLGDLSNEEVLGGFGLFSLLLGGLPILRHHTQHVERLVSRSMAAEKTLCPQATVGLHSIHHILR